VGTEKMRLVAETQLILSRKVTLKWEDCGKRDPEVMKCIYSYTVKYLNFPEIK